MSHYYELDGTKEKIFTLQCIALSGREFSKEFSVGVRDGNSLYSQKEYWRLTKSTVSNGVLELAIKIRNSYESLGLNDKHNILTCIEDNKVTRRDLIWVCNKIIHSKSFNLEPIGSHKDKEPLEWWNGDVRLTGAMNGKHWDISINVSEWLKSCLFYLQSLEECLIDHREKSRDLKRGI